MVSEEKSFESVDGRRTDDGGLLYKRLPRSLRLRGAKKQSINPFEPANFLSHKSKQSRHFVVFDILLPLCLSRRKISKYSEQENALEIVKYYSYVPHSAKMTGSGVNYLPATEPSINLLFQIKLLKQKMKGYGHNTLQTFTFRNTKYIEKQ